MKNWKMWLVILAMGLLGVACTTSDPHGDYRGDGPYLRHGSAVVPQEAYHWPTEDPY